MKTAIIIRYCEIHLKGKNRSYFEKLLKENIKKSLKGIDYSFVTMHSRYLIEDYAESDYAYICEKLSKIAGIHNYSQAFVVDSVFSYIFDACKTLCQNKEGTFKVVTNRADKNFTPNSMETSMKLGGMLLEAFPKNLKVDIKNPSFFVNICCSISSSKSVSLFCFT